MQEIWKTIEGFEDYQVSNYGRVKSLKFDKEKILKACKIKDGYLVVGLPNKNKKSETKRIHDIMFENFNNYKLKKNEVVHHIDFIKENNNLNNFQSMDKSKHHILHSSGENHPNSILTEKDVIAMKYLWNNNIKISNNLLAKWYKISPKTISQIKTGRRWKHI